MAKNPLITDGVRRVIAEVYLKYPDCRAKEIRDAVEARLHKENSRSKPGWPGLSAVQKELTKQRKTDDARPPVSKRLDAPWSIAASVEFGLSPEASKDLFFMWRISLAIDRPISIRQARWIVYLRNLSYQDTPTGNRYSDKVKRNLWLIRQSWLYSVREQASEIMGENHFDTNDLDAASFMPSWEKVTAVKAGKISELKFTQEALAKIEKLGTSLTSPPVSIKSVEQAVWHNVRAEPPQHMEIGAIGFSDEVLPEEEDLICAYWLMYLSKGLLWNNLPPRPEVTRELQKRRQLREKGHFVPDSGGFPDNSLYSRQLSIRHRLREWVKKHSPMTIRDYYTLTAQHPALVLSAKLLTMVGYQVPPEDLKLYARLHENELKQEHLGWDLIPAEVQQRFIHDNETDEDSELLNNADSRRKTETKQREQEFLELVQQKGGAPVSTSSKTVKTFWTSIRDEWIRRHPELLRNELIEEKLWYPQWEDARNDYKRLMDERNLDKGHQKEAANER